MPYNFSELKQFLGLFVQANSFNLPEGAMETAKNIVINDDNVISKMRGFYRYFSPGTGTLNALFNYQNKLVAIYNNKATYFADSGSAPNLVGTETVLSGATVGETNRTARGLEQNANLYFTSDNGVMKLDAYNGTLFAAGAPPGLDIRGNFVSSNGPIVAETQFAVRVLFGRVDANNNTILGAPSDILTLTNDKTNNCAYTSVIIGGGPTYTMTVTSPGHNLSVGMTVITSGAADTDANGTWIVSAVTATTFDVVVNGDPGAASDLDWTATRSSIYWFSIPDEISNVSQAWFYQVYRTSQSGGSGTSPLADFRLIDQVPLTSAEITAGFVTYVDEVDDILVEFAPELYTNPNSREGEDQANFQPPLCQDITLFNNYAFYGNCETRQLLDVDVVDASALVSTDFVEIKVDATTRRYVAQTGVGNRTVESDSITNAAGDLQVDYTAHGLANGDTVYISTITGGTLTAGTYYVVNRAANTFEISLTSGGAAIAFNSETSLYFEGVTNGTYPIFQLDSSSSTVSAQLRNTAQGLVKAVNRDNASLVYGNYISGITDTPGKMRFTAEGFTGVIYMRANSAGAGEAFYPILPSSFGSGTQVFSKNDVQPHVVYISKIGEPEAVPYVNFLPVGSRNKPIRRIIALRNSVIVLKEDGVWKITGDNPINFTATQLDSTVQVIAPNTAASLNNQIYFLAIDGICVATDSAVAIVSRRIENRVENIVGLPNISEISAAVAYDSDRTYRICTTLPNQDTRTITYFHNALNDTWTESDQLFVGGVIGPGNLMYYISTDNRILRERKNGTRIDFGGQNYSITVTSVDSDLYGALIVSSSAAPMEGDFIVKDDVISRIETVTNTTGSNYRVTFYYQTNLAAADSLIMYARIVSTIRMAPYHGGMVERGKQFSQMQLHQRSPNITKIKCTFTGQTFGGSELTEWNVVDVGGGSLGWGNQTWGFFPWGDADTIDIQYSTQPAPVVRLYVPLFQQRNTFIQAELLHEQGGESMEIQAMGWTLRAYNERVTK